MGQPVRVGRVTGRAVEGEVTWPIAGAYARVRGDLPRSELIGIAAATTVTSAGRPEVAPPSGLSVTATGPSRPHYVREARYGSDRVGESDELSGGLTFTGVARCGGIEDRLYEGGAQASGPVHGKPAVVTTALGGNGVLAWEPRPGLVAYVGYSGAALDESAIAALHRIAEHTRLVSAEQWQDTGPQTIDQVNDFGREGSSDPRDGVYPVGVYDSREDHGTSRRREDRGMGRLLIAVASGALALFSTYWDDSLHTDVGRDTFWSAPHVLLYGSILATLGALALWGWPRARREGVTGIVRDPVLRWAAVSGTAVAVAAPADAVWHSAFGQDAVLWSPPHLLAIVATMALTVALLRAVVLEGGRGFALAAAEALVLAAALVPVMEYDSDAPQFSAVWYLPVVSAAVTLAILLIRRFDPRPGATVRAALLVTVARLLTVAFLALLGHSTPIVPPVLLVAIAADLVQRWRPSAWWLALVVPAAVHAVYTPVLPVMPHGTAVSTGQFTPSLLLGVGGSALIVLVAEGVPRAWRRGVQVAAVAAAVVLAFPLLTATLALAHDPGQGTDAGEARWNAFVREHGVDVTLTTDDPALRPTALVARRAGEEVTGRLAPDSAGAEHGTLRLHADGRWFLYATFKDSRNRTAESWVAVEQGSARNLNATRPVYLPPTQTYGAGRTAVTVVLYGMAAAVLVAVARSGRTLRTAPTTT
ncbi:hypothetical protein [Streptomyces canus]|uniref:hypothetical protein n=1 Tax=Streptomyces canus TaxID=58343 RepID=UPI0037F72F59